MYGYVLTDIVSYQEFCQFFVTRKTPAATGFNQLLIHAMVKL